MLVTSAELQRWLAPTRTCSCRISWMSESFKQSIDNQVWVIYVTQVVFNAWKRQSSDLRYLDSHGATRCNTFLHCLFPLAADLFLPKVWQSLNVKPWACLYVPIVSDACSQKRQIFWLIQSTLKLL
jgi:hypothetical protein